MPPTHDRILEAIRACQLFASLPDAERVSLAGRTETRDLDRREILFHRGDPADRVYLVLEGQLKLTQVTPAGDEVIVVIMGRGDSFAVVASMQDTTYPVAAEATVPSCLLWWRKEVLAELMRRFPAMSIDATQMISRRMRRLQDRFREVAALPVPARLARELVRLAEDHGVETAEGLELDLVLSREDLAQLTGTTLYTVSRLLSGWQEEGIVAVGRQKVVLKDLDRLEEMGEGGS